eukprot:gene282-293_t
MQDSRDEGPRKVPSFNNVSRRIAESNAQDPSGQQSTDSSNIPSTSRIVSSSPAYFTTHRCVTPATSHNPRADDNGSSRGTHSVLGGIPSHSNSIRHESRSSREEKGALQLQSYHKDVREGEVDSDDGGEGTGLDACAEEQQENRSVDDSNEVLSMNEEEAGEEEAGEEEEEEEEEVEKKTCSASESLPKKIVTPYAAPPPAQLRNVFSPERGENDEDDVDVARRRLSFSRPPLPGAPSFSKEGAQKGVRYVAGKYQRAPVPASVAPSDFSKILDALRNGLVEKREVLEQERCGLELSRERVLLHRARLLENDVMPEFSALALECGRRLANLKHRVATNE